MGELFAALEASGTAGSTGTVGTTGSTGSTDIIKKTAAVRKYDYIIIDCPPSIGILSINALTAADDVIIPTTADYFSLQGLGLLFSNISKVKKHCNPNIIISGLLLVRYNNHTILSRDLRNAIETEAKRMNTKLYHSVIRESISIREAQAQRQSIFTYAPKSNAAVDYENFIKEYLNDK